MPHNLAKNDDRVEKINIENISYIKSEKTMAVDQEEVDLHELGHQEEQEPLTLTQKSMKIHNLLSLPHLPTKQPKGKEPLVDYFQSHVITFQEYHIILKRKAMGKVAINETKKQKGSKKRMVG